MITSSGDIRVDGTLSGSINTKGKVVVGSTGMVEGNVNASNADVSGELKGSISVSELLALKSTAKLDGDIVTNKLAIEPGASFTGSCSMGAVIKDINHAGKQENKKKQPKRFIVLIAVASDGNNHLFRNFFGQISRCQIPR